MMHVQPTCDYSGRLTASIVRCAGRAYARQMDASPASVVHVDLNSGTFTIVEHGSCRTTADGSCGHWNQSLHQPNCQTGGGAGSTCSWTHRLQASLAVSPSFMDVSTTYGSIRFPDRPRLVRETTLPPHVSVNWERGPYGYPCPHGYFVSETVNGRVGRRRGHNGPVVWQVPGGNVTFNRIGDFVNNTDVPVKIVGVCG